MSRYGVVVVLDLICRRRRRRRRGCRHGCRRSRGRRRRIFSNWIINCLMFQHRIFKNLDFIIQ